MKLEKVFCWELVMRTQVQEIPAQKQEIRRLTRMLGRRESWVRANLQELLELEGTIKKKTRSRRMRRAHNPTSAPVPDPQPEKVVVETRPDHILMLAYRITRALFYGYGFFRIDFSEVRFRHNAFEGDRLNPKIPILRTFEAIEAHWGVKTLGSEISQRFNERVARLRLDSGNHSSFKDFLDRAIIQDSSIDPFPIEQWLK